MLLGIVAGAVLATLLGQDAFREGRRGALVRRGHPFQFGMPSFNLVPTLTMCIVMIVVMIESLGMFLALGEITGKIDRRRRS